MPVAVRQELLEAATELGPLIREYAEQTERDRRLARRVLDALAQAGFLRMWVPESLGGQEVDPVTIARVIEAVARFDSAAGWALMVANSIDWWCSRLPDDGAEEIYTDSPDAIIAVAFHPPARAVPADGGYRITGRAPLASNIHEGSWLMLTAQVERPDAGDPEVIGVILPRERVEIIDTWYSLGMRGTDSNDVAVTDEFVPMRRTFPIRTDIEPGSHYRAPLYRIPLMLQTIPIVAPVSLAVARNALDEFVALAQGKTPFGSATMLRERTSAQAKLARAEAALRSARAFLYEALSETWERTLAEEPSTLKQKADVLLAGTHAMASAARAVELVYAAAGTSAIYTRSPLERHFRDIQVLKQHGFISESRMETVGQAYLGLEPEFAIVGL